MSLILNSKHSSRHKKIEELYLEFLNESNDNFHIDNYSNYIDLINLINSLFQETNIWCLTSHRRLVLMNTDDWQSNWFVIIAVSSSEFYFEYLIPTEVSPWKNAYVKGVAKSLEEAKIYLLTSMKESQGWKDSIELKNNYLNCVRK
jgi:hypothetical protein